MDRHDGELPKNVEYIALQAMSAKVETGIQQSGLEELCSVLFSEGLIDLQMKSVASSPSLSNQTRAATVLNALLYRIKTLPEDLDKFIKALSSVDTLEYLGQQLRDKREEMAHRERERIEALQLENEQNQQKRNEMRVPLQSRSTSAGYSNRIGSYASERLGSMGSPVVGLQASTSTVREISTPATGNSMIHVSEVGVRSFTSMTSPFALKGSPSLKTNESPVDEATTPQAIQSVGGNRSTVSPITESTSTPQASAMTIDSQCSSKDSQAVSNPVEPSSSPLYRIKDVSSEPISSDLIKHLAASFPLELFQENNTVTVKTTNDTNNGSFTEETKEQDSIITTEGDSLPPAGDDEAQAECSSPGSSISSISSVHMCSRHMSVESTGSVCSTHNIARTTGACGVKDENGKPEEAQQETQRSHSSESFVVSNPKQLHRTISCPRCMKKQLKKMESEIKKLQEQKTQQSLINITQQLEITNLKSTYESRERQHLQERSQLENEVYERGLLIQRMKMEYNQLASANSEQDREKEELKEELKEVKAEAYDLRKDVRKEKQRKQQCPQCNLKF